MSLSKKVQSSLLNGGGDIPSVQAPTESPNETSVPLRQASDILVLESQNDFLSVSTAAGSSNVVISNNANTNEFQDPIVLRSAFQATLPEYEHFVVALDQAHPYPKIVSMNRGEMCTALLRVNLRSKEEALQWLADYQTSSSTDWRVRRTFEENTPCIIFKKEFRCHNNTLAQYRPKTKKCRYKHTLCEASLMITVKNFKMQRSSDKFLKTAPCEIVINNFHNHPLAVADSLRLRRPTQQVKDAFLELYRSGHSPSSAHRTFTFDLQMKHGDEFFKVLADGAQCPTKQWCYQLYYKTFKAHYGVPDGQEMLQSLQDAVNKYNTDCGSVCAAVEKTDSDVVVAICTPLMKRVHLNLKTCSEMVFMDAGGGMDRQNNRIFVILSPSVAGALPVGLILTSSESEEMVTIGLKLLMTIVPPNGFYGRGSKGPEIFMTDDSTAERNAIMNVFPDAILLLCLFHILQAFWKYVTLSEHKVSTNDQLHIFNLFRDWCYVEEEKEFMESYSKILEYSEVSSNSILKKHVIDLYDRRSEWALCFRSDYLTRGNNTNNYAESSIRQMKESIMERTRAYSLVQLFDFMTSRLELYYERRISFVLNNRTENFYKSKHFTRPEKLSDLICSATSEENFYIVENLTKKTKYVVDMNLELCGCPVGRNGKACKHQFAVIEEFKLSSSQFLPFQDEEAKLALHKIMSTVEAPPGWYGSLKSGPTQFSTGFPAVPVPSTITSGENNGDSAIDNELGEDMQVVSSDNNAVDISAEANNAIEMWSQFDAYVLNGLKNRPEVFVGAVQRFMDGFRRAKSSSENAVLSAMHNFNRVVKYNRPKHNQGNIGVNRLSVQRRKRPVGGRQCVQTGRPARAALTAEHGFARQSKKPAWERKAPPKRAFPHQVTERAELMSYNKKPKKC
ncbi:hypothetical protein FOCC_FOCC013755 [Frankliniella occidentalis]|nr:hypothetical protein FOCC_FOCC013755 [Frankliniella occidentalis]